MNEKEKRLLMLINDFSECIGVSPPKTIDVGHWWQEAVEKMSDFQLLDLKCYGFLSKSNQPNIKRMNQLLIKQIEKRQLLNTLV
ncbi:MULTISPECIES: hypothetical protein [unclassified Lysinibacillus]|uniref:hypothetical protein n=1 Tax=unclassified Lysinibacillus TaxID=2636778 RepID=UPI003811AB7C